MYKKSPPQKNNLLAFYGCFSEGGPRPLGGGAGGKYLSLEKVMKQNIEWEGL